MNEKPFEEFENHIGAEMDWNSRAELGSEPPYDELLRCLENDWNISASWDGLRRFWDIELTEEGVRLRDAEPNSLAERTCRTVEDSGLLHCSECGAGAEKRSWAYWYYCPNCGSRVVNGKEGA